MDSHTVLDLFQQIITGEDIPQISYLLKRIKPEAAIQKLPGWPYSILTNLEHADYWQRIWLARISGAKRPSLTEDWREPEAHEFEGIRARFIENLNQAEQLAASWPYAKHPDHDKKLHTLVSLAIHDAYHIGQIKLMARILTQSS